ncbi:MAG: hypothetical protein AB1644_04880 [Candidatus Zixiibacteriota bacterium]
MTAYIDFLFYQGTLSTCRAENDVDRSGTLDIADLMLLIDVLFFQGTLPACLQPTFVVGALGVQFPDF